MSTRIPHDPQAKLDYTVNWDKWLAARGNDTISTATATVTLGGATITNVTHDATTVTFWVSAAQLGRLDVAVHIVTAAGREDDRSMEFVVTSQ